MKTTGVLPEFWPQYQNGLPTDWGPYYQPIRQADIGWTCPKCSRVHAPFVTECAPCNDKAATITKGGYGFAPAMMNGSQE
jgi:hypothetical protein